MFKRVLGGLLALFVVAVMVMAVLESREGERLNAVANPLLLAPDSVEIAPVMDTVSLIRE